MCEKELTAEGVLKTFKALKGSPIAREIVISDSWREDISDEEYFCQYLKHKIEGKVFRVANTGEEDKMVVIVQPNRKSDNNDILDLYNI